jgi:hypothetical protein
MNGWIDGDVRLSVRFGRNDHRMDLLFSASVVSKQCWEFAFKSRMMHSGDLNKKK